MVQRVVMVSNLKGGSGKTSAAVNLAAALTGPRRRVLVVDLDPQGSASAWLGCPDGESGLLDVLRGSGVLPVHSTSEPGLDLVPFDPAERRLKPPEAGRYLRAALSGLAATYSCILIDTPPTINALTFAALVAANHVLIPVEMSAMALQGVRATRIAIGEMQQGTLNPGLSLLGLLPCRVNARTALSRAILAALRENFPGKVFSATIRESVRMQTAPFHQKPISAYAPGSQVAQDFRAAADELRRRS
jgi:chromosome partitioning protein